MMTFKPGDTVAFSQAVIRRTGHGASARGTVVSVHGRVARVDWHGTWIGIVSEESGTVSTIRSIPAANLTRVLANGAVFGD